MDDKEIVELTRIAFLGSGIVVFLIGLLMAMGTEVDTTFGVLALIALVALSANFFYHTGLSKQDGDERLASIANRAMAFSWYLTLIVILMMVVIQGLGVDGLTTPMMLGSGLMVMIKTMVLYNEIEVRRGVPQ